MLQAFISTTLLAILTTGAWAMGSQAEARTGVMLSAPQPYAAGTELLEAPQIELAENAEVSIEVAWLRALSIPATAHVLLRLIAKDGASASWTWHLDPTRKTRTSTGPIRGKHYDRIEVGVINHGTMTHRLVHAPTSSSVNATSPITLWASMPIVQTASGSPSKTTRRLVAVSTDPRMQPPRRLTPSTGATPPVVLTIMDRPLANAVAVGLRLIVEIPDRTRPPEPERKQKKKRRPDPTKERPPRDLAKAP